MEVTVLSLILIRIVPVSSRIRFGSVMVIMDLVYAKVMKNKMKLKAYGTLNISIVLHEKRTAIVYQYFGATEVQ